MKLVNENYEAIPIKDILIFDQIEKNRDEYRELGYMGENIVITTLIDGHHGIHLPEILFDMAGIKNVPEDYVSDLACSILEVWTEQLQDYFSDDGWSVGYYDEDQSICVMYHIEYIEIKKAFTQYCKEQSAGSLSNLISSIVLESDTDDYSDGEVLDIIMLVAKYAEDCDAMREALEDNYLLARSNK